MRGAGNGQSADSEGDQCNQSKDATGGLQTY